MQINTRRGERGVYFKDPNGSAGTYDPDVLGPLSVKYSALFGFDNEAGASNAATLMILSASSLAASSASPAG
jgi:hypothetical protein